MKNYKIGNYSWQNWLLIGFYILGLTYLLGFADKDSPKWLVATVLIGLVLVFISPTNERRVGRDPSTAFSAHSVFEMPSIVRINWRVLGLALVGAGFVWFYNMGQFEYPASWIYLCLGMSFVAGGMMEYVRYRRGPALRIAIMQDRLIHLGQKQTMIAFEDIKTFHEDETHYSFVGADETSIQIHKRDFSLLIWTCSSRSYGR